MDAVYEYRNLAGEIVHETVRQPGKRFFQRRPDGHGGYINDLVGVARVLFRLPEIQGVASLLSPEGEKDVLKLVELGFQATTNVGGTGMAWAPEYTAQLVTAGCRELVILPDADVAGEDLANDKARSVMAAGIATKIVRLPGLDLHQDVSDWLDLHGHTREELVARIKLTPWLEPGDIPPAFAKPNGSGSRLQKHAYPEVYRTYLSLPPTATGRLMLRCPFHEDDTPSFSLDLNKGVWFCHAQHLGGGVIAFVQHLVKRRTGVTIGREEAKAIIKGVVDPVRIEKKPVTAK